MKKLVKFYIESIPGMPIGDLEKYIEEWLDVGVHSHKDIILPYLIKEKLDRYEKEL